MSAMWASAWALGWWLLALFVLLCWCVGGYRRFKRLRTQIRAAFEPVDAQLQQALHWLHGLSDQAQVPPAAQAAFQALQPTADLLSSALAQVRANPLHAEALAQLDGIWQSLQAAWQAYVQTAERAATALQSCAAEEGTHTLWLTQTVAAWQEQHSVLLHRLQAFNQAVQAYNQALALAPGSWWAKVLGLHPARGFALSTSPL